MACIKTYKSYNEDYLGEKEENCCLSPNVISCHGYNVCNNCGKIISRVFSFEPIKRYFSNEKVNFANTEPVRSPFGSRTILNDTRDYKGNSLSPKALNHFERLAKINRGLINGFERNLSIALPKFKQMKSQLNIPTYIIEEAVKIYVSATKLKLTIGRTIEGILSVAIYCALKIYGIPRSIEEILSVFQISRKDFMNCYKAIFNKIIPHIKFKIPNFTPQQYIDRFYEELELSISCRNLTMKVIEKCKRKGLKLSGKDPKGFAAASLYLSSKQNNEFRTQKQICEVTNVSEITLRMRLKEINSLI
ncbi:MAG: transcription initiation factor IIB family protein [Promethearchaeota archaeon]